MEKLLNILLSRTTYGHPGGLYIEGSLISVLVVLMLVAGSVLTSLIWLYHDAKRRNKNPWIAFLFIFASGYPASFIWWFWLRPELPVIDPSPESDTQIHLRPVSPTV